MRQLPPKITLGLLVGLACIQSAIGCGEEESDRVDRAELDRSASVARPDAGAITSAVTPPPGSVETASRDANGFATINGQRRFLKLV